MNIKPYTIAALLLVSLTSSKLLASSLSTSLNTNNKMKVGQEPVFKICDITKGRNLTQDELNGAPIFLDNDTKLVINFSEGVYFGEHLTFSAVSSDTSILNVNYKQGFSGMSALFAVNCTPVSNAVGQATVTITSNGGTQQFVINVIDPNSDN